MELLFDAYDVVFLERAMAEGSVNAQKALFKPIAKVVASEVRRW